MSFTFEKDFSINYCTNGGYLVVQSNMIEKQHVRFERAFSNLTDLTNFLLEEKRKFQPEPSFPINMCGGIGGGPNAVGRNE